jgi:hypothetical protein
MPTRQTVVVIVDGEWYHSPGVLRFLRRPGQQAVPPDAAHYITAPLIDATDPIGIRLGEVTTTAVRRVDGKEVIGQFVIPWRFVHGFLIVDESERNRIGFAADPTTIVLGSQQQDESEGD